MLYLLSTVPIVFILELLIVGWDNSSLKKILRPDKSVQSDFFYFFLFFSNTYRLLVIFFSFGFFHIIIKLIRNSTDFNLIQTIENPYLQFFILFLIYDLNKYIVHYIFHKSKTLWTIHEFHHSATSFSIFTRYRFNPIESPVHSFIGILPFVIFGSIETFLVVKVFSEFHQLMQHSAIKSNWGFIGKYILISPAAHRVHHSCDANHFDKNFGVTFVFWDRLFNTYSSESSKELGLPDNQFNKKGVVKDLFKVVTNFYRAVYFKILNLYTK